MRRFLLVFAVIALGSGLAMAQDAAGTMSGSGDNLFLEAGGGLMTPEGEDSTGLLYGGVNYGMPVADDVNLGLQMGGKFTLRDNDPDWLATVGLFQRDIALGVQRCAWSIQGIYHNTWAKADLLSLKPVFGMEIDPENYLAVVGLWGLNDEMVDRTAGLTQQETDMAMLIWGTTWSQNIRTEAGGGYAFGDVDSALVGVHAGVPVSGIINVNATGQFDFDGNYYAALSLGFDLGGGSRNATFNNISSAGDTAYTPFPMGSLPVTFYETQVKCMPGPVFLPE